MLWAYDRQTDRQRQTADRRTDRNVNALTLVAEAIPMCSWGSRRPTLGLGDSQFVVVYSLDASISLIGRPFVKRFDLCYQTVVCLSVWPVLSVTLVYCGQTVGRIKMKLSMQVGLGTGHIVLDGDPPPLPQRGTAPQFSVRICCAKWLHGARCHLVWSYALVQATLC